MKILLGLLIVVLLSRCCHRSEYRDTVRRMRAVVLYVETGYGFKSPSIAIAEELKAMGVDAQIVDLFDAIGARRFDRWLKNLWRSMLKHEWLFRLTYFIGLVLYYPAFTLTIPLFGPRILSFLDERRPDFVVVTHFMALFPVERLLRSGRVMRRRVNGRSERVGGRVVPVFGYNSEVIASHPVYRGDLTEMFFVATEAGKRAMMKAGSKDAKVAITGFPIDKKYMARFPDRSSMRTSLGLKDQFTIVLSFGGEGIGDWSFITSLASRGLPVQIVLVCGKNEALREEIAAWYEGYQAENPDSAFALRILGFVTDMQNWLHASDASVGKAGLNAVFESIYLKRPFMAIKAMANERYCAQWLEAERYGWWPRTTEEAVALIERRIRDASAPEWKEVESRLQVPPCEFSIEGMARTMITMTKDFDRRRFEGVKAICFDLAGTLCDIPIGGQWESINEAGIASVLDRLGVAGQRATELAALFVDEKKRLRKDAKISLREYEIRGQLRDFLTNQGVSLDGLGSTDWDELEYLFIKPELDITVRFDEAKELLDYLRKKYPLFLLSNNVSRILVERILEGLGLADYFDRIFVSSEIGYRKPHEKFMEAVLAGVPYAPGDCVMIGDRLSQDIELANRFGMRSIHMAMVEHEDNQGCESVKATVAVGSLLEIRELL